LKKLAGTAEGTDCTLAARFAVEICSLGDEESVIWAVNPKTPVCVVVPETIPVLERVTPLGSVPALIVQVYGVAPPEAANCTEKGIPLEIGNIGLVPMANTGVTVTVAVALIVGLATLVAVTVALVWAETVGAMKSPVLEIVPRLADQIT